jgi:hypothetical protein
MITSKALELFNAEKESTMQYSINTPIYTSDTRAWRLGEIPQLLDILYAKGKPIVLFVHGRGKEPKKSLRGGTFVEGLAVRKIERGYDCSVLMFNWDSAFSGFQIFDRTRPLANAIDAALSLAKVLTELNSYFDSHKAHSRPALLVHSMGSIVIQNLVKNQGWSFRRLFRSIVFSQPDADDIDHAEWLESLASRERVYVTFNRDDHVLARSNDDRLAGARPLGLGTNQPLAQSATYIDLTNMGALGRKDDDHEVFAKGAMNGQLYVCEFFTQALVASEVDLVVGGNVKEKTSNNVYVLKQHHEPSAPCLQKPILDD